MQNLRTLFGAAKGTGMTEVGDGVAFKLWSPNHLELEFAHANGRVPVFHLLLRNDGTYVLASSLEDRFDVFLDWSVVRFSTMDAAFPVCAELLRNHYLRKRERPFVTRAIEPYSKALHWFLCVEAPNPGKQALVASDVVDFLEGDKRLPEFVPGLALLGDRVLDDLNPSTLQVILRGVGWANRKILGPFILGEIGERIGTAPKWVEFLEKVADGHEALRVYESRFCVDDLREALLR